MAKVPVQKNRLQQFITNGSQGRNTNLPVQSSLGRHSTEEAKQRLKEINYIQYEHSDNDDENNSFTQENHDRIDIHSSIGTENTRVAGMAEDTRIQDGTIR